MNNQEVLQEAYRLIKTGDKAAAVTLLRPVIKQDPNNANVWWILAHALTDPAQIRKALEKVLEIDPFHDKAQEKLDRLNSGAASRPTSEIRLTTEVKAGYKPQKGKSSYRPVLVALVIGILIVAVVAALVGAFMLPADDPVDEAQIPTIAATPVNAGSSDITAAPTDTPAPSLTPTSYLPPTWTPMPTQIIETSQEQASFAMSGQVPRFDEHRCDVEIPGWAMDGRDVICGDLIVPANWQDPTGPSLKVAVSIIKSLSDMPRPDPLVVLQGGPGGSSVETFTAPMMEFLGEYFLYERDIIMIDQRGTLHSEPALMCNPFEEASLEVYKEVLTPQQESAMLQQVLVQCRDLFQGRGIVLANYNSLDNAHDVEALRQVLGYEEYNLYGVSYGSLLALHVLRNYPVGLRSVMIDAVVPPQVNYMAELPRSAEDAFDRFFLECEEDPICNANFPDLENVFNSLVQRLNAQPLVISIEHPDTGRLYDELYINGDRLVDIVFSSMYSSGMIRTLPRLIYDIYNGNTVLLRKSFRKVNFETDFSMGVYYSVNCQEDGLFDVAEVDVTGVRDYLANTFGAEALLYRDECAAWGVADLGAALDEPVVSDVPVLIYVGEFDPIIGSQWGLMASETLPNSKVYIFPGIGHGAAFDDLCPLSIMVEFLAAPETTPSPACIRDMDVDFSPPSGETYVDGQGRYSVTAPSGWDVLQAPGYATFVDPETGTQLFVTAVDQRTLATGIATGVQQVFPNFDGTYEGIVGLTIIDDDWQVYLYTSSMGYVVAAGLEKDGITYVAIARTDDILGLIDSGVYEELLAGFDYQ